jgi:DNA-binding NtrC family response regulator
VQSSLLRALDTKMIVPVGDTRPREIDLRVIAASNQDLSEMVDAGEFRGDLLYRLNVVRLDIPALRDRKDDIPMLVQHFLDKHCRNMNKHVTGVSDGAMSAILNGDWRGNVRELENVIERAVIFADGGELRLTHLPFATDDMVDDVGGDIKSALRQFERQHIMYSMRKCGYDKAETARHLGIGVSSLYRKLDEMDIPKSDREPDATGESDE